MSQCIVGDVEQPRSPGAGKRADEGRICARCGQPMEERKCKIVCGNCGFSHDCSDP
jgi:hypothetical protein